MPLYIVPTPIGNLEDITLRALRVLREANIIACEDTRTSGILLRHYDIHKPLISFHVHNENDRLPMLLEKLREGQKVAVISDAGTPGISDPGWILLKHAIDEGLCADVLPGPSAVIPAVLMSGINPQPFAFMGFPPEKHGQRVKLLEAVRDIPFTLCFYMSPHKAGNHIADIIGVLGDREAALVREISKVYQECIRGSLSVILERVNEGVKGELVLVVSGCNDDMGDNEEWRAEAMAMLKEGAGMKDIASFIEERYRVPRNEIKKYILSNPL